MKNKYYPLSLFSIISGFLMLCISLLFNPLFAQTDNVNVSNSSGSPIGVLVDGKNTSGVQMNDAVFTSPSSPVNINAVNPGSPNEVTVFTVDRPVTTVTPAPFTTNSDNVSVSLPNKILIPVTVYITYGD